MKRTLTILLLTSLLLLNTGTVKASPFIRNFTTKEYNAHNRCFDVLCDKYGTVFVANFEGLLYYDGATWRKIHTPGINRVTRLIKGKDGKIYVSGHDFYGYIAANKTGSLHLVRSTNKDAKRLEGQEVEQPNTLQLNSTRVSVIPNNGLTVKNEGQEFHISEVDGLASNNVANIAYDGGQTVWVATNRGITAINAPSPYWRYSEGQGLKGEVYSIGRIENAVFVGTMQGLYRIDSNEAFPVGNIDCACWTLTPDGNDALIALTSEGRYRVTLNGIQALPDDGSLKKYLDAANMKKMADTRIRYAVEFNRSTLTRPFAVYSSANIVYRDKENIMWVGGDFGIVACDMSYPLKKEKPQVYLREISIMNDSILWGGYLQKDLRPISTMDHIEIPADCRSMTVRYSVGKNSVFSPAKYRYRINGGNWSAWSSETVARFNNMPYGPTLLEIEAQDLNGNISDAAKVSWFHQLPLYLRWWAILCYIFIIIMIIRALIRWRMKNVEKAKIALERIVKERTKDLKNALDEKERMQADMVRMERNATAGKLTQGLIDRILNPINYINNFSKLTNGLAKDLTEDIEDEKENMSEDGYEDCMDILDMMNQNLGKIEEHGENTTRTLRAMEAMLNNNIGTPRDTNISALCQQAADVTKEYHKMEITTDITPDIHASIDPETVNKALLSLLSNAVYAVNKKAKKAQYKPEVKLSLKPVGSNVEIRIHDNGIGIEDTIIDKVFDPFFTTKTTGEGTGVGLFLTREIVQAHGGTITLNSVKDEHTEFLITFKKL